MKKLFCISFALIIMSLFAKNMYAVESISQTVKPSAGIPNISANPQIQSNHLDLFAQLLYWRAEESGSENWAQIGTGTTTTTILDVQIASFKWEPGFRVGLGYTMPYDQWDTQLSYTWYRTESLKNISTDGSIASPFFGNLYDANYKYKQASLNWSILFNMFDLDLGRNYLVSDGLALRPFLGLKGGWIRQKILTSWNSPTVNSTENLKNNFWGIGPNAGLNTQWRLSKNKSKFFSLLGDFSTAFMWGDWSTGDVYKSSLGKENIIDVIDVYGASIVLKGFMGFGWDLNFNKERSHVSIRLGYEMQAWLDQLQIITWNIGRLNNQLTLQGGSFDCRLDF